jgi:hypothetical protein
MKSREIRWTPVNGRPRWLVATKWRVAICGAALLLVSGCGGSQYEDVTGKIMLNGVPMTSGKLVFSSVADGPTGYATIGSDGAFTARLGSGEGLPAGEYKVAVKADPGANVPMQFADSLTTPLTIKVAKGSNPPYELKVP